MNDRQEKSHSYTFFILFVSMSAPLTAAALVFLSALCCTVDQYGHTHRAP